jgi:hypothetical protein
MKTNYLNNRDILKEIHKSKTSYCSYSDPKDADFDIIINSLNEINANLIEQAAILRAERLARASFDEATARGEKRKIDEFFVDPLSIPSTDIVFRVMTFDHIPKADKKKPAFDDETILSEYDDEAELVASVPADYVKVNFPPFQHYKLDQNSIPYCVGKSHWQGDLDKGRFCKEHGKMTPKLATMFMKLCERYATRSNWRGYTYVDEMKSQALLQLSHIGLQFNEAKSSNPFAYFTATINNSFTRVLNIEKRNQNLRDDILEMNNLNPSFTRQQEWGSGSSND